MFNRSRKRADEPVATNAALEMAESALSLSIKTMGAYIDTTTNMTRIANDAIVMARDSQVKEKQAMEAAKTLAAIASTAFNSLRLTSLEQYFQQQPEEDVLSGAELQAAAELLPLWSISSTTVRGEAKKFFTRHLDDLNPAIKKDEAYKRFCNPEHFDINLIDIFNSWDREGDYSNDGMSFTLATEAGPITQQDLLCVVRAERYLFEAGFVIPTLVNQNLLAEV